MVANLFTNTLLCLSLVCLIVEPKLMLNFGLFAKQTNINKLFPELFITSLVITTLFPNVSNGDVLPNFWIIAKNFVTQLIDNFMIFPIDTLRIQISCCNYWIINKKILNYQKEKWTIRILFFFATFLFAVNLSVKSEINIDF